MINLQSWVLAAVAVFGALIAYFQWRTAHQRVVLDLFDRRVRVFELAASACGSVISSGKASIESLRMMHEAMGNARFLFGEDVNSYLKKLIEDFAFLHSFTDDVIRDHPAEQHQGLWDRKHRALTKIGEYQNEATAIFVPYMHLAQKMPSTWLPW